VHYRLVRFPCFGLSTLLQVDTIGRKESPPTISPIRANAGSNVGGASLWLSMPSNTSTNLLSPREASLSKLVPGAQSSSKRPTPTANCARFSHLPPLPLPPTACAMTLVVVSNRCLPVIHSALFTIAYCNCPPPSFSSNVEPSIADCKAERTEEVIEVFPVASCPYRTMFFGGFKYSYMTVSALAQFTAILYGQPHTLNKVVKDRICCSRHGY
jgi:hypothetical protein